MPTLQISNKPTLPPHFPGLTQPANTSSDDSIPPLNPRHTTHTNVPSTFSNTGNIPSSALPSTHHKSNKASKKLLLCCRENKQLISNNQPYFPHSRFNLASKHQQWWLNTTSTVMTQYHVRNPRHSINTTLPSTLPIFQTQPCPLPITSQMRPLENSCFIIGRRNEEQK